MDKNEWGRNHYRDNPQYYKDKSDRVRAERRQWLLENVGDSCSECGSTENLEFDHINPALKTNRVSFHSMGLSTIKEQVDNIQTLCHDCHVKKSTAQKKAAWSLFCQLSLEEQNELIRRFL